MLLNVKIGFPILFRHKDFIPKDLISGVFYNFQCGLFNEPYYGKNIVSLDIGTGKNTVAPLLTGKKVEPSNKGAVYDHFGSWEKIVFIRNNKILIIMRDKLFLNWNVNSPPLHLIDKVS